MSLKRENLMRSVLKHITEHSEMAEQTIILDQFEEPTSHLATWFEVHLISLIPDSTRRADDMIRGTLRVLCRSRKQPSEPGGNTPLTMPYEQADRVVEALRGVDVEVRDWVENGGTSAIGYATFDEVQIDDVGEAEDGVRTLICTTTFMVAAPLAA